MAKIVNNSIQSKFKFGVNQTLTINAAALLGSNSGHRRQLTAVVHGWGAFCPLAFSLFRTRPGTTAKARAGEKKSKYPESLVKLRFLEIRSTPVLNQNLKNHG